MLKEIIKEQIKEIIIQCLPSQIAKEDIIGNDLINELGINSVDALEIFVWIENTFEIQIDDEDLNSELIASLDNLTEYVFRKKNI